MDTGSLVMNRPQTDFFLHESMIMDIMESTFIVL